MAAPAGTTTTEPITEHTPESLQETSQTLPEKARALVITTREEYEHAAVFLKGVKALQKEAGSVMDPIVADTNRAHKTACAQRTKVLGPMKEAELIAKTAMSAFLDAEERRVRQEQLEREAAARKADEERKLAEAAAAEARGDAAEADAILEEAPAPAPAPTVPERPKVKGVSSSAKYVGRVVDVSKFAAACVAGNTPATVALLDVRQTQLDKLIDALGGAVEIPGVVIERKRTISARS